MSEDICVSYMSDIASAVAYMHSLNVVHRDLKPENVLVGPEGTLKVHLPTPRHTHPNLCVLCSLVQVADFGCAVLVPPPHAPRLSVCGTPEYLSPEMLQDTHAHSFPVDMWALGVFMFELIVGR